MIKPSIEDFDKALSLLEIFGENLWDLGMLEYEDINGALDILEEDLTSLKSEAKFEMNKKMKKENDLNESRN